ncbi:MAG: tetratricopeptide repeat protein [Pirellulales bacterium]|nr:tetratricopeptide repeat protein [Pirellulales bacterium]
MGLIPSAARNAGSEPVVGELLTGYSCLRVAPVLFETTDLCRSRETASARAAWVIGGVLLVCVLSNGCSNIQSQAANVEGVRLYQQGNYQQASDLFHQAIAQNPQSPEGYYNLAASLHKTGTLYNRPNDLQQAEILYNQCLERNPNHAECYRGLAVLLTETNRKQEAFNLLNHWAGNSPKSAEPRIEIARLLEESGQAEQAKAQLVDALTIDPHNARALTALGRLRDQSGDPQQALANYKRSLTENRFQPEVSARVAQLQGVAAPTGVPATAGPAPSTAPAETRTANGSQPAVRY